MAPEIPYKDNREPDSNDKIEAAVLTFCALSLVAMFLAIMWVVVGALWQSGLTNFVVVTSISVGLLAIGRAVYRTILEKGF